MKTADLQLDLRPVGLPHGMLVGRVLMVAFFIPPMDGEVRWEERHRTRVVAPNGQRPKAIMYSPEKTKAWHEHCGTEALRELRSIEIPGDKDFVLPIRECRLLIKLRFNIPRPSSVKRQHVTVKPDLDNFIKGVLDGLVQADVLQDDCWVTDLLTSKRYEDPAHPAGVEVEITALPAT